MDDLVTFLNARLDEDEAAAEVAGTDERMWPLAPDPARVLREVKAERAILAEHMPREYDRYGRTGIYCRTCVTDHEAYMDDDAPDTWPCATVRHLAAVWDGHPDYRPEWKP
jgi:hypothetical protein